MAFLALNGRLASLLSSSPVKASTAVAVACILGAAYLLARRSKGASPALPIRHSLSKDSSVRLGNRHSGEYKMVILLRSDLAMSKGKAAAQACHAALAAYKTATKRNPSAVDAWETAGQPKVTLKVDTEADMIELVKQARAKGLVAECIRDAGRTQLEAGTRTVAAIGPASANAIDSITGHLKLY